MHKSNKYQQTMLVQQISGCSLWKSCVDVNWANTRERKEKYENNPKKLQVGLSAEILLKSVSNFSLLKNSRRKQREFLYFDEFSYLDAN